MSIGAIGDTDSRSGVKPEGGTKFPDKTRPSNGHSRTLSLTEITGVDTPTFARDYESSFSLSNFSIKELRDAVPAHLFQRSALKSSAYLLTNVGGILALFYAATWIQFTPWPLPLLLWPAYWALQGIISMGLWILGHECGHQTFSDSKALSNGVGFLVHSFLLTPYYSWRISHAQHHAGNGHIERDVTYVPKRRSEYRTAEPSPWEEALESSPLWTLAQVAKCLVLGWPFYLAMDASGKRSGSEFTSHYLPSSPLFKERHRGLVLASNAGVGFVIFVLGYAIYLTDFSTVLKYYGIPYLMVNGWIVCITLLHHTDVYLPHLSGESWNFVRGSLLTVDRDYGWFLNTVFHHVQDSHICHHFFSTMPHYNAIQATPYLKEKLGAYYLYDRTPFWKAMYRVLKYCLFVEDSGDVLFYRTK